MRSLGGGSEAPALEPNPDSQKPQIGDVLDGRYQITGVLGTGGMGCVYLAVHTSIQRACALKLLHPEVGEVDEVIKRFEREAFAIGRMDHPNCVQVSDFGKLEDGTLYMVLELLDGVLLFDLLELERPLGWRRSLHIARHILSALEYAHASGIVHRDVKPENVILVQQDGDKDFAKIVDFGIAKLMDDDASSEDAALPLTNDVKLTQAGVTIGTPTYIAPEQAYGLPIDGRADLYSVSIMLYEMIAGEPPFDADEIGALLRMHISAKVLPFAEVAPFVEVPSAVEKLIFKGLEKKVDDRIESATEYIARIDEILAAETNPERAVADDTSAVRTAGEVADLAKEAMVPLPPDASGPHEFQVDDMASVRQLVPSWAPDGGDTQSGDKSRRRFIGGAGLLGLLVLTALGFLWFDSEPPPEEKPYAAMGLGHDQARKELNVPALIAYEEAVSLDPTLANNKRMRANVEAMLSKETAPEVAETAIDFLGTLVSVARDQKAETQLVDLASASKDRRKRQKAFAVANEVGLGDRIDLLSSYTLDLQQGETCQDRKAAVTKLRALGDKRAIPALRKARNRPRGGLGRKRVNTNACLRGAANEAVKHLQAL